MRRMIIDITAAPPADIFQDRARYIWLSVASLTFAVCGVLLAVYALFFGPAPNETLETFSLVLFVGPGLFFVYFAEKLQAYKRLTPQQTKELADLGRAHPEIAAYCALVAKAGRPPILAEYEACEAWSVKFSRGAPAKPE